MNTHSKYLSRLLGAFLLLASAQGQAIPTLFFDGTTNYNAGTGLLSINAVLSGSIDIAPPPGLAGSSLTIAASFNSTSTSAFVTTGFFKTAPGAPDLSIVDGGATTLLEGEILDLILRGADGLDFGILAGNFTPTAGSLLGDFTNPSGIFALELNLTSVFSSTMFNGDFSGQSDGRVTPGEALPPSAIPEPDTLLLLALSLFGLAASQKWIARKNVHQMSRR